MEKIKVRQIIIGMPEGVRRLGMRFPVVHEGENAWFAAGSTLRSIASDAPRNGGYDKTPFKIVWENGATYEGRADVKHWTCENNDTDLLEHVRGHLQFLTGKHKPWNMSEENYSKALELYRRNDPNICEKTIQFLDSYQIGACV